MSFWEEHKNALIVGGLGLLALLAGYLAVIGPSRSDAAACREEIATNDKKLAEYYPELKSSSTVVLRPTLRRVREDCDARYREYGKQLSDLKARLRFPFEDFKYAKVPDGEVPGVYLIHRSNIVARNVEVDSLKAGNRGTETQLEQDWLGFAPSVTPDKVTKEKAEEELRKLCLAEQVTRLAIEAGLSRVIKVRPLGLTEEAATRLEPNKKFKPGGKEPEMVPVEYANRFIVSYPVSIEMVGSMDSVMRFFHSVRQEKRFLVIRSFRIRSGDAGMSSGDMAGKEMRQGEVHVTISAACMDFREGESKPVKVVPAYVPRSGPVGA